jgi:hypothetical protein
MFKIENKLLKVLFLFLFKKKTLKSTYFKNKTHTIRIALSGPTL